MGEGAKVNQPGTCTECTWVLQFLFYSKKNKLHFITQFRKLSQILSVLPEKNPKTPGGWEKMQLGSLDEATG